MIIVKPSVEFVKMPESGTEILRHIERIGRVCYKSEENITDTSAKNFVRRLIKNGHLAMIEHESFSVRIICDRGISHEIVRHRLASYAQTSTRYCNYASGKFGRQIQVICPVRLQPDTYEYIKWREAVQAAEKAYLDLVDAGIKPEIARSVLPTCLATEIIVTMNLREWRHFFSLRADSHAHPQMQEIAYRLLHMFKQTIPVVFDDLDDD